MFKSKRGSHVGVVLSFLLFITFVIFMYVLLNSRINQEQSKTNSLENIKAEILERVSGNLTSISVKLNGQTSNCVELSGFLSKTGIGNRILARDDSGNILSTGIVGQNLQVERAGNTFFRVYSAEEFSQEADSLSSCRSLSNGGNPGYVIGLSKAENLVFESKITRLLNNYTTNYAALKTSMGISSGDEFRFVFAYSDGAAIKTPESNVTINVYADSIPVQYIKTDGAREVGSITALVW